ncbi:MAG: binding protein [Candidatus Woesebacteria bacterium GW2011_GWA1_37_8]|uniref:Binding protein n=2 Tax=Candidatus Woeseibacteriota TaxID=1752722 RepID=A0A0G0PDD9_9BACT|nr:MAG: binding protein [Microgenomates group bacterium GW2011_GWC1_37_12b]KKQ44740.1 MAG: binding protein [Candidatus Woesebacteria bacterium GW2011_GWA1_37_8]KKQ87301.1 MAG: binding protein [Candidatus Woesebacteria bacterium GW2011_GWB1_38_8b]
MTNFTVRNKSYNCYIAFTLGFIGGKWKTLILWNLIDSKKRFGELRKIIPDCSQRMLTRQLRELEQDGIVARKIYKQIPPKVEYSLTPEGKTLTPILRLACNWGTKRANVMTK